MFDLNQKQLKQKPLQNKAQFKKPDTDQLPVVDSRTSQNFDKTGKKISCAYCKRERHIISDCLKLKAVKAKREYEQKPGPNGLTINIEKSTVKLTENKLNNEFERNKSENQAEVHPGIRKYMHSGEVSLIATEENTFPVNVLRDTGATSSLLKSGIIPDHLLNLTDDKILIKGLFGSVISLPVVNIHVQCNLG